MKFEDLPVGARFRFLFDDKDVWVYKKVRVSGGGFDKFGALCVLCPATEKCLDIVYMQIPDKDVEMLSNA